MQLPNRELKSFDWVQGFGLRSLNAGKSLLLERGLRTHEQKDLCQNAKWKAFNTMLSHLRRCHLDLDRKASRRFPKTDFLCKHSQALTLLHREAPVHCAAAL